MILSFLLAQPLNAQSNEPLSAIDWLSDSVEDIDRDANIATPDTIGVLTSKVTVTSLDPPSLAPIGLPSFSENTFSTHIWDKSDAEDLIDEISTIGIPELPAMRNLLVQLMIAEAIGPKNQINQDTFLLARIDKLLDLGQLEYAQTLLEITNLDDPVLFRRYFDVSLLTGDEDEACDIMMSNPSIAPTYPARIFCLARTGDWPAAALTLNTHKALGDITEEEDLLLGLFLDPEVAELNVDLPMPSRVTPLIFRIQEAIGEYLSTSKLPLAFAHADLRDIVGWKVQIEAAERLARAGAISPEVLHNVYTAHHPSASGGVWDRVAAIQAFDLALASSDADQIASALRNTWAQFQSMKLEQPLAALYATKLHAASLEPDAAQIAFFMSLLANRNLSIPSQTHQNALLIAVGTNMFTPMSNTNIRENAVLRGLQGAISSEHGFDNEFGHNALSAIKLSQSAMNGNSQAISEALILLRRLGLDLVARQTAIEYLILDRQI